MMTPNYLGELLADLKLSELENKRMQLRVYDLMRADEILERLRNPDLAEQEVARLFAELSAINRT